MIKKYNASYRVCLFMLPHGLLHDILCLFISVYSFINDTFSSIIYCEWSDGSQNNHYSHPSLYLLLWNLDEWMFFGKCKHIVSNLYCIEHFTHLSLVLFLQAQTHTLIDHDVTSWWNFIWKREKGGSKCYGAMSINEWWMWLNWREFRW